MISQRVTLQQGGHKTMACLSGKGHGKNTCLFSLAHYSNHFTLYFLRDKAVYIAAIQEQLSDISCCSGELPDCPVDTGTRPCHSPRTLGLKTSGTRGVSHRIIIHHIISVLSLPTSSPVARSRLSAELILSLMKWRPNSSFLSF